MADDQLLQGGIFESGMTWWSNNNPAKSFFFAGSGISSPPAYCPLGGDNSMVGFGWSNHDPNFGGGGNNKAAASRSSFSCFYKDAGGDNSSFLSCDNNIIVSTTTTNPMVYPPAVDNMNRQKSPHNNRQFSHQLLPQPDLVGCGSCGSVVADSSVQDWSQQALVNSGTTDDHSTFYRSDIDHPILSKLDMNYGQATSGIMVSSNFVQDQGFSSSLCGGINSGRDSSSSPAAPMNSSGNSSGGEGSTITCDPAAVPTNFPTMDSPSSLIQSLINSEPANHHHQHGIPQLFNSNTGQSCNSSMNNHSTMPLNPITRTSDSYGMIKPSEILSYPSWNGNVNVGSHPNFATINSKTAALAASLENIQASLYSPSPPPPPPPAPPLQSQLSRRRQAFDGKSCCRDQLINEKAMNNEQAGRDRKVASVSSKSSNEPPAPKRPRIETPSPLPTFKVRKEKLGDRITALQQLVSPFGKTDTASVLHEAIEYIKFLHDQVNALSTSYMKSAAPIQHHHQQGAADQSSKDHEGPKEDLMSRGLCLVPISSTFPVAHETPADFWTPTFGATATFR